MSATASVSPVRRTGVRVVLLRALVWGLVAVYLVLCAITAIPVGAWTCTAWIGYVIVGAILLSLGVGSRIGAMMLLTGLYWAASGLLFIPGAAERMPVLAELAIIAVIPVIWGFVPLMLVLYPDDRIRTGWGRATAVIVAAVAVVLVLAQVLTPIPLEQSGRRSPFAVEALGPLTALLLSDPSFLVVPLLVALAVVDLVMRWRRSTGVRRYQFRWFTFGGVVTAAVLTAGALMPPPSPVLGSLIALLFNVLPLAILVALTRHGLYEVDRVISRTVAYAIVTLLAIGVYAAVVTSATWLFPALPSIGVALATLAAAALFLPVLRWVQRAVDRRFDRARYDADRVVEAFGARLQASADPATASAELVDAVERALHPACVGLWTKGGRS